MKKTKFALLHSIIALVLCVSMLVGTTFAWFTDSVSSMNNIIQSGRLDIELDYFDGQSWVPVNGATNVFDPDALWEPGYTQVVYLRIRNEGNLALKYQLGINVASQTTGINVAGETFKLSDYIHMGVVETSTQYTDRKTAIDALEESYTLSEGYTTFDEMTAEGEEHYLALVVYMPETVGNEANYRGQAPQINLGIALRATQLTAESDSFDENYDEDAAFPELKPADITLNVTAENGVVTEDVTVVANGYAITVQAGTKVTDTTLTLTVTPKDESDADVTLEEGEEVQPLDIHVEGVAEDNEVPLLVTMEEALSVGLNIGNYTLYHVEDGETNVMTADDLSVHNGFTYDPATGDVTVAMASFSEVAMVADTENPWNGEFKYDWYDADATSLTISNADQLAAFGAIVGGMAKDENGNFLITYTDSDGDEHHNDSFSGKIVTLIADINLGDAEDSNDTDKIFYPIGYWNNEGTYEKMPTEERVNAVSSGFYTFEGTFDGNGHTISNFYQNTWEMKGDHNWYDPIKEQYYRDGMGLFGKVYGGTVKNLTVSNFSSDGEIATTGVIAAYADGATFENIAITNCNPRVYNIGNGGIVGVVGWYAEKADLKTTFTNITVDNSNKISALWGSYDVACGGIVGQYYPTSGQSSAEYPENAGIDFVNCHVAAQMDVYNDVCANYQYYAYRYTGMLIGSIRENETIDGHSYPKMDGITAENCTVHFGDWNDYYYCELVANSLASYTHDHQMSRLEQVDSVDVAAMTYTIAVDGVLVTNNIPTSGRYNYVVVDGEHATENATCYHFVDGEVWKHEDGGYEEKDINGDGVVDSDVLKEDKQHIYLEFNNLVTGYGWGVTSRGFDNLDGVTNLDITQGDQESSVKKFETKFTGDYLYRVGNQNEFTIGNLFAAKSGATINNAGVYVRIDKHYDDHEVSCTFTANTTDWTKGTLKFEGTGVVDITIQDYDYCEPTVLHLEVIDAYNAASDNSIRSATDYDVALISDITDSNITVSDGHTFYGNGFELEYTGDGSYRSAAVSYGFVTVTTGGTLDHVDVMCEIFPKSYAYTSEMTADSSGRYPYGYSAIVVSGNSTISNCYVYGARNNIQVGPGNVTITNTVTECGSLSNIHIKNAGGNTVTLDNVTTIQYQTTSTFDTTAKVLGFGVMVGLPDSTSYPTIELTGDFVQHNWVTSDDIDVSNTYAKSAIEAALKVEEYQHTNSKGDTTVNTGIAYLNTIERTIVDTDRTNDDIQYGGADVTISGQTGYVYSIVNESGNPDAEVSDGSSANTDVLPTVTFTGEQSDTVKLETAFDSNSERWVNTLTLDLDNISGGTYDFNFGDIKVQKYGVELSYTVEDSDGNAIDTASVITVNQLFSKEYALIVADTQIFDESGALTGETVTRKLPFVLYATKTSIDPPTFTGLGEGTTIRTYETSFDISSFSNVENWRPAYKALENVTVTYWSAAESTTKTIYLSDLDITEGVISSNVWTYTCDDFTLTITGGQVHTDGSKISPIVVGNELYFWSADKAFGTGTTSRNIILTYVFTDKNATTTEEITNSVAHDELTAYDKDNFAQGTLTEHSDDTGTGGGGCVTGDTLVTLADGSQKRIDQVTYADELLVWDFYNGCYTSTTAAVIYNHGDGVHKVTNLHFSDGTTVKMILEHEFFDVDANSFVYISEDNVADYIGHQFVKAIGDGYTTVTLTDYSYTEEETGMYTILTAGHFNAIVEGMFSLTPDPTNKCEMYFRRYEVGADMKFDEAKMQADIEKYGLYTYEDFADYVTYEEFLAFDGGYLKVLVGKGLITFEDILNSLSTYAR